MPLKLPVEVGEVFEAFDEVQGLYDPVRNPVHKNLVSVSIADDKGFKGDEINGTRTYQLQRPCQGPHTLGKELVEALTDWDHA